MMECGAAISGFKEHDLVGRSYTRDRSGINRKVGVT